MDYKWTWNVKSYQTLKFSIFSLSMLQYTLLKILLKIMDEFWEKNGFGLWSFEMITLCLSHIKNEKYGFKNYVIIISK